MKGDVALGILIDRNSRIVIQGITGREASMVTKHMLAYGTPVVAGVTPGKKGEEVHGVPVYDTLKQACARARDLIRRSFMCRRPSCWMRCWRPWPTSIKLMVVITENIPQHDVVEIAARNRSMPGPGSSGRIRLGQSIRRSASSWGRSAAITLSAASCRAASA